LSGIFLHIFW